MTKEKETMINFKFREKLHSFISEKTLKWYFFAISQIILLAMTMTLCNNSGTCPSSPNPPAVVYRDVAVAGGAP